MTKRKTDIGNIILFLILGFLALRMGGFFGATDVIDVIEHCNIIGESCDNYEDCKIINYKGETIACINGEKIISPEKGTIIAANPPIISSDGGTNEN